MLLTTILLAATTVLTQGDLVVKTHTCDKCTASFRIMPDNKTAYVNLARVAEADVPAVAKHVAALMEGAKDASKGGPLRPTMGWSSWNSFELNITEPIVLSVAETMATNGLKAAGYTYVNIDDGHFYGRDEKGKLRAHPVKFPNGLKPVVDRIHALGLKAGIYSDAGDNTCGSVGSKEKDGIGVGFYGHEDQDAQYYFGECDFDFIKVDWCGGMHLKLKTQDRYTTIKKAIDKVKKDVRFNICCWCYPGKWAEEVAGSWRICGDIRANWESIAGFIKHLVKFRLVDCMSLGHYNDLDMLEVGYRLGKTKTVFGPMDTGLTVDEEEAHFGMWSFLSSPLLIGCDVRKLDPVTLKLVTNPFLIGMNQNDIAAPIQVVARPGDGNFVFVKDCGTLGGTSRYVAVFNAGGERPFTLDFEALELGGKVQFFDLAKREGLGTFEKSLEVTLPAHSAKFYRLDAEKRLTPVQTPDPKKGGK